MTPTTGILTSLLKRFPGSVFGRAWQPCAGGRAYFVPDRCNRTDIGWHLVGHQRREHPRRITAKNIASGAFCVLRHLLADLDQYRTRWFCLVRIHRRGIKPGGRRRSHQRSFGRSSRKPSLALSPIADQISALKWYDLGSLFMYGWAYICTILAFFMLAIQIFVTYLEFYLVCRTQPNSCPLRSL